MHRLKQKGLLKRYTINCYGNQPTVEEMRALKAQKFEELKNKRNSKEYEQWFLRYSPRDNKKPRKNKTLKAKKKSFAKKISIPGKINNSLSVKRTQLPDTLKENYSFTPDKTKTIKSRKPKRKGKKSTRKKVNFLGFRF